MNELTRMRRNIIELFVDHGEFDTTSILTVKGLVADAAPKLDSASSHEICGTPVFRCADGKWYTGTVEFVVNPVNPVYLENLLGDGEHCECQNCGHIEGLDGIAEIKNYSQRVTPGEVAPAGECRKCHALSHVITQERAQEIAGITKKKPARRRGGLK